MTQPPPENPPADTPPPAPPTTPPPAPPADPPKPPEQNSAFTALSETVATLGKVVEGIADDIRQLKGGDRNPASKGPWTARGKRGRKAWDTESTDNAT